MRSHISLGRTLVLEDRGYCETPHRLGRRMKHDWKKERVPARTLVPDGGRYYEIPHQLGRMLVLAEGGYCEIPHQLRRITKHFL